MGTSKLEAIKKNEARQQFKQLLSMQRTATKRLTSQQ